MVGPHDVLANGTRVTIGRLRGRVVSHKECQAHPCGTIIVHTVKLTERSTLTWGHNRKWVRIKDQVWTGNYTALNVVGG